MADEKERNRLYGYKQNSNLVISNRGDRRRGPKESSGEAQPFHDGRIVGRTGDRAGRSMASAPSRKSNKGGEKGLMLTKAPDLGGNGAVVGENEVGRYRPQTRESQAVFEQLLAVVQRLVNDQPRDVLHGAVDEVIAIMKDEDMLPALKLNECRKLLGRRLDEAIYGEIVRLCEKISDYAPEMNLDTADGEDIDGQNPAAPTSTLDWAGVISDSEDDSDQENASEVQELEEDSSSSSGSDNEGDEVKNRSKTGKKNKVLEAAKANSLDSSDSDSDDDHGTRKSRRPEREAAKSGLDKDGNVNVRDIDAFWIQRQLGKYYEDANITQALAVEILAILGEKEERACENQLLQLLNFSNFELIKVLLQNRKRLWFCVRIKQAASDAERESIKAEMSKDLSPGGGQEILDLLESPNQVNEEGTTPSTGRTSHTPKVKVTDGDVAASGDRNGKQLLETTPLDRPPKRLDLQSLAFGAGDHTMTNKKVKLPGAWRKQHKDYEEVHVPPLKPRPFEDGEKLVAIQDLPEYTHGAFANMTSLNRIQSSIYPSALNKDCNLLICAPTGAGKTNVAVLTVLREVGKFVDASTGKVDVPRMKENMKIVYVAPMKALVQEVVTNFSQRLGPAYGLVVRELSGDQQLSRAEIAETQIIVTTPEKWDIVTRKAGERAYTQLVRLVIIDEIHLLHNERGAVLEAIIARMVRLQELTQVRVRIVGISATLPNYKDVATFCRVPLKEGLFFFDNSYRPVPLQQQYIGITETKPLKRMQKANEICFNKVVSALERNRKDQIIVFVHSRKETTSTAMAIRDLAQENDKTELLINADKPQTQEVLQSEAEEKVRHEDLKEILPNGLGIHHAGMPRSDRTLVENLFKAGFIKVLVSTATLAWGVNLPAHSVIIKGTQVYNPEKGQWTELSQLDILQMLGRAGRPQYDVEGEGIIITTHAELQFYLSLLNEQLPIESQLIRRLVDSLNAEIVMGTVQTLQDAARWIGYTYLYVRMLRNPIQYGISIDELDEDKTLWQRRLDLVHSAAILLDKAQLVRYDRRTGYLQGTPLGKIASHFYVSYDSMQRFNEFLRPTMTDLDLFRALSLSKEFAQIVVREEEKIELAQLADRAPVPVKESLDETSAKVNLLLQSYVSGLSLEGYALACDLVFIQQSANRIVRALFELCLARGWASLSLRTLDLANVINHKLWPSQCFLRQFKGNHGLDAEVFKKLERHNLSVEQLFNLSEQELGELCGGGIRQGRVIHRAVHCFPNIEVEAQVQPITRSTLRVELALIPNFEFNEEFYGTGALQFWIVVEDGDGETILHKEAFTLHKGNAQAEHETDFIVPILSPLSPQYFCKVICDRFMHSVTIIPISFSKLILPERFAPPSQLLDLRPLPTSRAAEEAGFDGLDAEFVRKAFQVLFQERYNAFNKIQTQTFPALYKTDKNIFVASPCGSGKTALAELALARALARDPTATCVYVNPKSAICKQRFVEWNATFGKRLARRVVMLTGDTATDLKLLGAASLVIATAEAWDNVSRRWKSRKVVRLVSLFVADDLHLLEPVLEIVVSRMRIVAATTKSTRIVGLSASIANGQDLGNWIGATTPETCFSFQPSHRPNSIEIELRGFDENHFGTRLIAMARPTFDAVLKHTQERSSATTLVFVPSSQQTKIASVDLVTFATAHQSELHKGQIPPEDAGLFMTMETKRKIAAHIERIEDPTLKETLAHGVGFLHSNMQVSDRSIVEACYETGIIRILVVASDLIWGFSYFASLVVVQGTSHYDGNMGTIVDYSVANVTQMVGRASQSDAVAKCAIFCHSKRKALYKRFLNDPLPVESQLHTELADTFVAEIDSGTISNKQLAVDYITWSLLYRRLTKNPNFYNLLGTDTDMLSDYLSELVEDTLQELADSKCIKVWDNEMDISILNYGRIASHYYLQTTTIKLFATNLTEKSKLRRVLDVLVTAGELEVPVRQGESRHLASLAKYLTAPLPEPDFSEPRTKAHVLLQLHFSRRKLTPEQRQDLNQILDQVLRLLHAMINIATSNGWLRPALAGMELSQMIVQSRWNTDSPLLQIPHFTQETVERCKAAKVLRVEDIGNLDEDQLEKVLQLSQDELARAAEFCNSYPVVELKHDLKDASQIPAGSEVKVSVSLEREVDEDEDEVETEEKVYGKVIAPFYPKSKIESYWLVIGQPEKNKILSIKEVTLGKSAKVSLVFSAPKEVGKCDLKLYLLCDSVIGSDQVVNLDVNITPGQGLDDDSSSSSGSSSGSSSDEDDA